MECAQQQLVKECSTKAVIVVSIKQTWSSEIWNFCFYFMWFIPYLYPNEFILNGLQSYWQGQRVAFLSNLTFDLDLENKHKSSSLASMTCANSLCLALRLLCSDSVALGCMTSKWTMFIPKATLWEQKYLKNQALIGIYSASNYIDLFSHVNFH